MIDAGNMAITQVPIGKLKLFPGNPRRGDIDSIVESIAFNGFFNPVDIQKGTHHIISGNHSWQAAKKLNDIIAGKEPQPKWWSKLKTKPKPFKTLPCIIHDVTDNEAIQMNLAANRIADRGTYDRNDLIAMFEKIGSSQGTGYTDDEMQMLLDVTNRQAQSAMVISAEGAAFDFDNDEPLSILQRNMPDPDDDDLDDTPGKTRTKEDDPFEQTIEGTLNSTFQLDGTIRFPVKNSLGIPELRKDMLVDKLPEPIDTWAGIQATPDDGVTTWLWNYGLASTGGLPFGNTTTEADRIILSFFTYDTKFEQWWDYEAYYTSKVLNAGVRMAIVPDFSLYEDMIPIERMWNVYRAQYMGRFFQEAGIKVIPRIQFCDPEDLEYSLLGVPANVPVAAISMQHFGKTDAEKEKMTANYDAGIPIALSKIKPKQLLVYGGNPAKVYMEKYAKKTEIVFVENYAAKRRGTVFDRERTLGDVTTDVKRTKVRS